MQINSIVVVTMLSSDCIQCVRTMITTNSDGEGEQRNMIMSSELMTSSSLFILRLDILTWFALRSAFVPVPFFFIPSCIFLSEFRFSCIFSPLSFHRLTNKRIHIIVFISILIWCTGPICISNVFVSRLRMRCHRDASSLIFPPFLRFYCLCSTHAVASYRCNVNKRNMSVLTHTERDAFILRIHIHSAELPQWWTHSWSWLCLPFFFLLHRQIQYSCFAHK